MKTLLLGILSSLILGGSALAFDSPTLSYLRSHGFVYYNAGTYVHRGSCIVSVMDPYKHGNLIVVNNHGFNKTITPSQLAATVTQAELCGSSS